MSPEEKVAYREKIRLEKLAEKMTKLEELKKIREEERNRKKEERDKVRGIEYFLFVIDVKLYVYDLCQEQELWKGLHYSPLIP